MINIYKKIKKKFEDNPTILLKIFNVKLQIA